MNSCSPQALSCILRQSFYWGIFSFGLRDVVNLSTTFFIQRFFTFFIFFIKTRFLRFFILGVNVFYIYGSIVSLGSYLLCMSFVGRGWRNGSVDAFCPKGHGFDLWRFGVKLRHSIRAVSGAPLSSNGLEEAL